jgi:hypothetical protein
MQMTEKFDCTCTVFEHRSKVSHYLEMFIIQLARRSQEHDATKLLEPEKSMFDEFIPKLQQIQYGTEEYKANLQAMGEALQHHYACNRHHPEHFENGINGMTLVDLMEMLSDWLAAGSKNVLVYKDTLEALAERFKIDKQLAKILLNTYVEVLHD